MNGHQPLPSNGKFTIRLPESPSTRITAVGDLSLHGKVSNVISQQGASAVFAGVEKELRTSSLRVGNLETVISCDDKIPLSKKAQHIASKEAVEPLIRACFDVLSFANNHILDKGYDGIRDTLNIVRSSGISIVGAGVTVKEAREPLLVHTNGIDISFFAYSYGMGQIADTRKPGCNEAVFDDIVEDLSAVSVLKTNRIVSLHLDAEFQTTPSPARVDLCRRLVDAGANLILCHHPHVPQGIERWKNGIIAYSLGNYVTPVSSYMRERSNLCDQSFHLHVNFDKKGISSAEVVAIRIDSNGCPFLPEKSDQIKILQMLVILSRALGDDELLKKNYNKMVRSWFKETASTLYWALRRLDFATINIVLSDILKTKCKQKWFFDWFTSRS